MITNINSDTISMAPQMCNNILNLKLDVQALRQKRTAISAYCSKSKQSTKQLYDGVCLLPFLISKGWTLTEIRG